MRDNSSPSTTTSAVHCASGVALPRRDRHLRLRERRRVVDAVADHRDDRALRLQRGDGRALVFGKRIAARVARCRAPRRPPRPSRARSPESSIGTMPQRAQRAIRAAAPGRTVSPSAKSASHPVLVAERDRVARGDRDAGPRLAATHPDSAATKSGRPRRTVRPATTPSTPLPGTVCSASTRRRVRILRRLRGRHAPADAPIAPRAPRRARAPSRVARLSSSSTSAAPDGPSVSVPVLSSTTCVTRASVSSASARAMTTCRRASAPAAAASAAGVASDSAHGQDTTSTAKVTASARDGSMLPPDDAPSRRQAASNAPTNHAATRSATRATRGRSLAARSTSRETAASRVASPAAVTRTHERAVAS